MVVQGNFDRRAPSLGHQACVLEPLRPDHFRELRALVEAEPPTTAEGLPRPERAADTAPWIARMRREEAEDRARVFAVRVPGTGLVGTARLGDLDTEQGTAKLTLWIGAAHRGHGWGGSAARQTLDVAFGDLRLREVRTAGRVEHLAARRLLSDLGFEPFPPGLRPDEPARFYALEASRAHMESTRPSRQLTAARR